jgi:hypothetical protein
MLIIIFKYVIKIELINKKNYVQNDLIMDIK